MVVPSEPAVKLGMPLNKNKQPVLVVCHVVLFVVVLLDLDRTWKITFICCVWEITGEIFEILGRYSEKYGRFFEMKKGENFPNIFLKRERQQKLVTGRGSEVFIFTRTFKLIMFLYTVVEFCCCISSLYFWLFLHDWNHVWKMHQIFSNISNNFPEIKSAFWARVYLIYF